MTRPFARTFDLISQQYGWLDSQILDLTLGRMRQIRDVILERRDEDWRRELDVRETELQYTCQMIAASAGHKEGVKEAQRFRLYERPKAAPELPSYEDVMRRLGGAR